jgi:UDP-glucose 4-epimerase
MNLKLLSKNILVIGGAGYIGSHTCQILKKLGANVFILDDLSTGHKKAACFGQFFYGSVFDSNLITKILKDHKIDAVMHFAAKALVAESVANPLLYYHHNTASTINLISILIENNVENFVFSSTCATFGVPQKMPIDETTPQAPINPYGQSKLMVEIALKDICKKANFNAAILRYFNAAGADPEGFLGEDHKIETHLIPLAIKALLENKEPLKIFGSDYPTKDGTCIRDYIHVHDLAIAHILALNYIIENKGYHDFNLGTEQGNSVLEVINTIEKIANKKVPFIFAPRREGDPPVLIANSLKAKKLLNWTPQYSLKDIIKTAYNWHFTHPFGFDGP